jgi:hypothetical protein
MYETVPVPVRKLLLQVSVSVDVADRSIKGDVAQAVGSCLFQDDDLACAFSQVF